MKFVIAKDALIELISRVQNVVPQKATIPILSNILLEAKAGQLVLTATDLTVGARHYGNAKVVEEGATTLPARRFFQLVRELTASHLQIASNPHNITEITADSSRFRLHGMDKGNYPKLPDFQGATRVTLPQKDLREMLSRTSFAVSREDSSHPLTGIHMRIGDGTATFVGTDGKRLAKTYTSIQGDAPAPEGYLIPFKAVEEMWKSLGNDETATLYLMKDKVALEADRGIIITKLLSESYPDVERVIPNRSEVSVTLHREELMTLLRQVALFAEGNSHSVRFTFTPGDLTLTANSIDVGEGKVSMPVDYQGPKFEIAFNPTYFLDILRHSHEETVTLSLTDSYNPGVITDSSSAVFVIMPMRLSSS